MDNRPTGKTARSERDKTRFVQADKVSRNTRMKQRGFILFILLGIIGLLIIVIFSLSTHSLQIRSTTVSLIDEQSAYQAAASSYRLFGLLLEDVLKKRSGCKLLFPESGTVSPLDPSAGILETLTLRPDDIDEWRTSGCLAVLSQKFDIRNLLITAKFSFDPPTGTATDVWTPRSGKWKAEVSLDYKHGNFTYGFEREFQVCQILPKVASKFTLFTRQCTGKEMFNTVEKTFQDNGITKKLLTLFNHPPPNAFGATKSDLYKTSGWVFLGGGDINLNLDGSHPGFKQSEFFMFWPDHLLTPSVTRLPSTVTGYLPSARSASPGPFKMKVRYTPSGCMKDWVTSSLFNPVVGAQVAQNLEKISFLRLFGNKEFMAPTKVFGRVFARWVLYSTLIYDSNDDGIPELNGPGESWVLPLPRIPTFDQYRPLLGRPLPVTIWGAGLMEGNMGNPDIPFNLDILSPAWDDYLPLMTKLSTDFQEKYQSYNSLYDLMFDLGADKRFPPNTKIFSPDTDYPNSGRTCDLPTEPGGSTIRATVDLTTYDPTDEYEKNDFAGCAFRFSQQADFLGTAGPIRKRLRQGKTEYYIDKPFTCLIEGDLTLPSPLYIEAPCLLLAKGKVRIGSILKNPADTKGTGILILASLENDVQITGDRIESVILIASRGTIVPETDFSLRGTLSVAKLDPDKFTNFGGEITYEPAFDPTIPSSWNRGFVMILGPSIAAPERKKSFL